MLILGNVETSTGLKRELSSNILGLYTITPQDQDFDKCYPLRIIHHVPSNCQYLSALFHLDFMSNESSGKYIFITMPNRKIGYRAPKLSVCIKFWTLYKGKCL